MVGEWWRAHDDDGCIFPGAHGWVVRFDFLHYAIVVARRRLRVVICRSAHDHFTRWQNVSTLPEASPSALEWQEAIACTLACLVAVWALFGAMGGAG